jgi:hypothetical protein
MAEQTVEEYLKAQQAEWSVYVATEVININGARAFNPGDPVPASHVERGVVNAESVAKITTKAGREAAGIEES